MSEGALTRPDFPARQPLLRLASEARLVTLASQGSAPAFAAIYQRHHQDVYRYCRSIVRDEHDARDALQNTMIKAFSALEGEQREISLRPWLFRIAHNESITLLRGRSAAVSIETVAEVASGGDDAETRERLRGLIADLDLLTDRQRGALVMRELSGLEFSEIGMALETSPEGAKQAVYEARMALRELEQSREIACDEIRRRISADDRRRLRARSVRAHLKSCGDCREFAESIKQRSGQFAAIAPPLPAPIALGILDGIMGGGGGGGAATAAAAGGGGGGGILAGLGGGAAMKLGAAAIVAAGVGGVAVEAGGAGGTERKPVAEISQAAERGGHDSSASQAGAGKGADAGDGSGSGDARGAGKDSSGNGESGSGSGESGSPAAMPGGGASGSTPAAQAHGAPGSPGAGGPAATPPGQGGTPPGQGGTPPGLGTAPPGQGGPNPGQGGTPPGQGGTPPGQGGTPPGQAITPPGLGNTPPVSAAAPPNPGGANPGQASGPKS